MSRLLEALRSGRVLLMDGAMGTELQRLGLRPGECPELWNLTHPETVASVHRAYLEAGAEVLLTHTFQANPDVLAARGLPDRLESIWQAALANVHVFPSPAPLVLADVGPFRTTDRSFAEQLPSLSRGADGLLLETWSFQPFDALFSQLDARRLPLPLLACFTFAKSRPPKNYDGASAEQCAAAASRNGVAALGVNCGLEIDMDDLLEIVTMYRQTTDLPIFIRPNAGTPTETPTGWQYPHTAAAMAEKLWPLLEAGVTMVGGCCGTTPEYIAAFREIIDQWNARTP